MAEPAERTELTREQIASLDSVLRALMIASDWEFDAVARVVSKFALKYAAALDMAEECLRLRSILDGDPNQTATPEQRNAWRLSAVRYADKVEADNARLTAELMAANKHIETLRREVTLALRNNHQRNLELDALHYVWCDGGCDSGSHRWQDAPPTEDVVRLAVRNTQRLVRWWNNHNDRKLTNVGVKTRWEEQQKHERLRAAVEPMKSWAAEWIRLYSGRQDSAPLVENNDGQINIGMLRALFAAAEEGK